MNGASWVLWSSSSCNGPFCELTVQRFSSLSAFVCNNRASFFGETDKPLGILDRFKLEVPIAAFFLSEYASIAGTLLLYLDN